MINPDPTRKWRKIVSTASTPVQRIGLLLAAAGIVVFLCTAIHWNIVHRPFIYHYQGFQRIIEVPKPPEEAGATWKVSVNGWTLYDDECVRQQSGTTQSPHHAGIITRPLPGPPSNLQKCALRFVSHNAEYADRWESSFDSYWKEMTNRRWGDYFWFALTSLICITIGSALYIGIGDKLFQWIRTGDTDNSD